MELKRVVVTGLGALTPLGNNIAEFWKNLSRGVSGANVITRFDTGKFKTRFACELKNYEATQFFDRKEARKYDPYAQYGMIAADMGLADSGLDIAKIDLDRSGVIWASGIGGLDTFEKEVGDYFTGDGTPRFNPFFIPKMIADIASGNISIKYGFRGPNFATVSACASSANAMVDGYNYIRLG
ncbi:MAG: beta-ketoacyl-[acyl-carrier-protein] synthase II, partial [Bacteroidetes bacterium]|nr:beta-ketoacyl-[acyl-carrier-protein] synthase II [Bacteroidota bacterium]